MAAQKSSPFVPKLRFTDFVDEPPWECQPLKKLAKRITQRNSRGADLRALTNSAEHGVVDQREYFGRNIATNTDNYYIVETGDYVYNPRSSFIAPVGPISRNQLGTGVVSPIYTVFRFRSDENDFFAHYFSSSHWHGYMRRVSNSGARHDRLSITNDDLMQMPLPTPMPPEQQKITDCLGSLDNLIAAGDRKLESLRRHKQGLMQELFPQPGATVPRLRFPECRDWPEWALLTLSSACEINPRNDGLPDRFIYIDLESVKDSMLIDRKEIARDAAPSRAQRLLSNKDIIYQTVRPYQRNNLLFNINDGNEYVASTGYAQLRTRECPEFLHQLIHTDSFVNNVLARCAGSNYPAIKPSDLASIEVALPRKKQEQRKIAECLGSLDGLIAAEIRMLDALRHHKQGLMQQLFPSIEAVSR